MIPVEFYSKFWDSLKEIICESFNEGFDNGKLAATQCLSVITLIHKKDSRLELKNWRPISLLNHDYKILSCVLANRLKKIIPSIINTDQVGYIKGRYSGQNVRLIEDLIDFAEKTKKGGAILFWTFAKPLTR